MRTDPLTAWTFSIEVIFPVSAEDESLPQALVLHGNYPNPFRHSTRLMIDLPWPARVTVEVMDVVGRRVTVPSVDLAAGWATRHRPEWSFAALGAIPVPGACVIAKRQWSCTWGASCVYDKRYISGRGGYGYTAMSPRRQTGTPALKACSSLRPLQVEVV